MTTITEPTSTIISSTNVAEVTTAVENQGWSIDQVYSLIEAGGPVIIILAVMSVIALSVFLLKQSQFIANKFSRQDELIDALTSWKNNDISTSLQTLSQTRNPIARVLEVAISLRAQETEDDTLVREEVMRIAKRQLAKAKSHMRILEVIATLSPLLGLLGTVLGMITAFQKLQGAGAAVDPSILSGGIWEALLTTAAGLVVAIPTVLGLNWLEQKIENFKLAMEDCMTQVFTIRLTRTNDNQRIKQMSQVKVLNTHHQSKNEKQA